MDLLKIKKDLNEVGFAIITFPKPIKEAMIRYIKSYLHEVSAKYRSSDNHRDEISYNAIMTMSDQDYIANFSKPFRMYPENISQLIMDWIKITVPKVLGVDKADSNYVSPAERKINKNLRENTYDIFWRCVRPNKNDVGPAHCDFQFWNLAKNTDDEVPVPFLYRERWKIWIPLLGCVNENILQMMPASHREEVPMLVTETPVGKRPCLDAAWYEKNENRFIAPAINLNEDCIIFHDRLIHRGPKNNTTDLRISSELTVLVS